MNIQYSRGCPYDCEFCSIPFLNGRKHRTKNPRQFISELDSLRNQGWNGHVFIVDDNFIGNKRKLKTETLPLLDKWAEAHNYPFNFTTEASINLADDDELMNLMVKAGFKSVFVGIETPDEDSLAECGKFQNRGRDLTQAVKIMQRKGLQISGGFIVGFDHDTPSIFKRQIDFIQKSGIVTAMVGLLNAPKGTRLFKRLKTERRLLAEEYANNTGGSINFVPRMKYQKLIKGYKEILETIYSQKKYYERIRTFLKEYKPVVKTKNHISPSLVLGVFKSFWTLGILEKGRRYFWKLLFYSLFKHPRAVPLVITMAANGFHFRKITASI